LSRESSRIPERRGRGPLVKKLPERISPKLTGPYFKDIRRKRLRRGIEPRRLTPRADIATTTQSPFKEALLPSRWRV